MERASLTAFGFGVLMVLMVAAFALDAWSQIHSQNSYRIPDYLVEFCRLALQSALGATAFAGLREARRVQREKQKAADTDIVLSATRKPELIEGRSRTNKEASLPGPPGSD